MTIAEIFLESSHLETRNLELGTRNLELSLFLNKFLAGAQALFGPGQLPPQVEGVIEIG